MKKWLRGPAPRRVASDVQQPATDHRPVGEPLGLVALAGAPQHRAADRAPLASGLVCRQVEELGRLTELDDQVGGGQPGEVLGDDVLAADVGVGLELALPVAEHVVDGVPPAVLLGVATPAEPRSNISPVQPSMSVRTATCRTVGKPFVPGLQVQRRPGRAVLRPRTGSFAPPGMCGCGPGVVAARVRRLARPQPAQACPTYAAPGGPGSPRRQRRRRPAAARAAGPGRTARGRRSPGTNRAGRARRGPGSPGA